MGSPVAPGTVWWGGTGGTWFWIDPENDLFFLGMVQKLGGSNTGNSGLGLISQRGVYDALELRQPLSVRCYGRRRDHPAKIADTDHGRVNCGCCD